jgi:hypothetical protein
MRRAREEARPEDSTVGIKASLKGAALAFLEDRFAQVEMPEDGDVVVTRSRVDAKMSYDGSVHSPVSGPNPELRVN